MLLWDERNTASEILDAASYRTYLARWLPQQEQQELPEREISAAASSVCSAEFWDCDGTSVVSGLELPAFSVQVSKRAVVRDEPAVEDVPSRILPLPVFPTAVAVAGVLVAAVLLFAVFGVAVLLPQIFPEDARDYREFAEVNADFSLGKGAFWHNKISDYLALTYTYCPSLVG